MQRYPALYGLGYGAGFRDISILEKFSGQIKNKIAQITATTAPITTGTVPPPTIPPTVPTTTSSIGTFWAGIPTPIKIGGAALLAFVGYKKFLAKPSKPLSGARRRRR